MSEQCRPKKPERFTIADLKKIIKKRNQKTVDTIQAILRTQPESRGEWYPDFDEEFVPEFSTIDDFVPEVPDLEDVSPDVDESTK